MTVATTEPPSGAVATAFACECRLKNGRCGADRPCQRPLCHFGRFRLPPARELC